MNDQLRPYPGIPMPNTQLAAAVGQFDQIGPSAPRPPLLEEVTMLRQEIKSISDILGKLGNDFDQRLHRIECTLGLQR